MNHLVIRTFIALVFILLSKQLIAQSPEAIARLIANRFIEESSFELVPRQVPEIQKGVLAIYLQNSAADSHTVETVVTIDRLGENRLKLAANPGKVKIWRDDEILFEGEVATQQAPQILGAGIFKADHEAHMPPFQGDYKIKIEYVPTTEKRSIFLWVASESEQSQSVDFRSTWDYTEDSKYRFVDEIVSAADDVNWLYPKEAIASQFKNSSSPNDWTVGNGMMLEALLNASDQFADQDYIPFVEKHRRFFLDQFAALEETKIPLLEPPFYRYFRYQSLEDFATQTLPYLGTGKEEYKAITSKALNKLLYRVERTPEGMLSRNQPEPLTIWTEDLYYSTLLLTKAYQTTKSRKYLEEAVKQMILFNRKLRDKYSGLYWNGYFGSSSEHTFMKLARTNGMVMLAKVELLKVLPETHPERAVILKMFRDHAEDVRELQSLDGRWNLLLNDDQTFLESSGSAMFVTAFAEGLYSNWLFNKDEFKRATISAWLSIVNSIDNQSVVSSISPKIDVSRTSGEDDIQPISSNLIGTAAVLQAAIAMHKLNSR